MFSSSCFGKKYNKNDTDKKYAEFKNSYDGIKLGSADKFLEKANPEVYQFYKDACEAMNYEMTDLYLAKVFYQMHKDNYICAELEPKNIWYRYNKGVYEEVLGKDFIKILISSISERITDFRVGIKYAMTLYETKFDTDTTEDEELLKYYVEQIDYFKGLMKQMNIIYVYCKNDNGMNKVYNCSTTLFYVSQFVEKLNSKANVLGFGENVYDTTIKAFRKATKDDYISYKTGMTQEEYQNSKTDKIMEFLKSIFPRADQREYMLSLLSDSIYGKQRQRFCVNLGGGGNGKGILEKLMEFAFGDYYASMNASYITSTDDDCTKANSQLYKARYARTLWFDEPQEDKSEVITSYFEFLKENNILSIEDDFKFDGTPEKLQEALDLTKNKYVTQAYDALLDKLPEQGKALLSYFYNGGDDLQDYLKAYDAPTTASLDVTTEAGQREAVFQWYKATTSHSDERINKFIARLELDDSLESEAASAIEELKTIEAEKSTELTKLAQHKKAQQEKQYREERELLQKIIPTIAEKPRQPKLESFLFNQIKRGDEVKTPFNFTLAQIGNTPEHLVQLADILLDYDPAKGFNMSRFEQRASSKNVNNLKDIIEQKLSPKSKLSSSSTSLVKEDFDWNEFLSK